MENTTPSQENPQDAPVQNTAPVTQYPPIGDKGKLFSRNLMLGVFAVILVASSVGATYLVMTEKTFPSQSEKNQNTVLSPTPAVVTEAPQNSKIVTFTNENIEGLSFQYDPAVWELTEINPENVDRVPEGFNKVFSESGILMKEKKSDGVLYMKYGYEVGMGGGMSPIYNDSLKILSSVMRVKINNMELYKYGLRNDKTMILFNDAPEKKDEILLACEPGYEGYVAFDPKICPDIESGKVIGMLLEPVFSWSLELKRIGEVAEIWPGEDYLGQLEPEMVQIEAQYIGDTPENADVIITQLFE